MRLNNLSIIVIVVDIAMLLACMVIKAELFLSVTAGLFLVFIIMIIYKIKLDSKLIILYKEKKSDIYNVAYKLYYLIHLVSIGLFILSVIIFKISIMKTVLLVEFTLYFITMLFYTTNPDYVIESLITKLEHNK